MFSLLLQTGYLFSACCQACADYAISSYLESDGGGGMPGRYGQRPIQWNLLMSFTRSR